MLSIYSLNYTKKLYYTHNEKKFDDRLLPRVETRSFSTIETLIQHSTTSVSFAKEFVRSLKGSKKTWASTHRKQLQKNTVELRGSHHRGTVIFVISSSRITYADVRDQWNRSLLSSRTIHDTTCLTSNIPVGTTVEGCGLLKMISSSLPPRYEAEIPVRFVFDTVRLLQKHHLATLSNFRRLFS